MNEGDTIRVLDAPSLPLNLRRYVGREGLVIEVVDASEEVVASFPGDQDAAFKWQEVAVLVPEDQQLRAAGEPTLPGLDEPIWTEA